MSRSAAVRCLPPCPSHEASEDTKEQPPASGRRLTRSSSSSPSGNGGGTSSPKAYSSQVGAAPEEEPQPLLPPRGSPFVRCGPMRVAFSEPLAAASAERLQESVAATFRALEAQHRL